MKKLLVLSLFMSEWSLAQVAVPKRSQELMKLLNQEMRILETANKKGAELYYRMLELQSEKLKLVHEKNNLEFLEKSKTVSVSGQKESFFMETRLFYGKTKDFALKILKDYPQNNRLPYIKFAMAINSRDYGRDNITEKYLLETISLVSDPFSSLRHHAETALADFYYNEKNFNKAITYYERVIKKTKDAWRTKHLFNLSWCYLKVREFDKAISNIKEAYTQSKNKEYVNMKDQALDNIGPFYVYAGRPLEGLEFYVKNEADPVTYLMMLSYKASDKGHQKETEEILRVAQDFVSKNNWVQYQEELFHADLDFYRHYNRFQDHEKISHNLVKYYQEAILSKDSKYKKNLIEESIEKMRTLAGFLQVKLIRDMKQDEGNFDEKELKLVLSYFDHLMVLDTKRVVEYLYFRAETNYSIRKFKEAAFRYVETIDEAKRIKNDEFARKALNSLLALTGLEVLPKDENKKYLTHAYSEHIALWPIDEKSEKIYSKLFEIYREAKDDEKATIVLRTYNKNYPVHVNEQQTLMTKVLDQFIESKNTNKLALWIHEFKSGFLNFPKDTIEKTEIVLGNMLFMEYQEISKKGNKLAAAQGFESIYENKLYTSKIKSKSAFFASLSYLELSQTEKSFEWLNDAWKIMNGDEKNELKDEKLKISERSYRLQDFMTSHKIARELLNEYCAQKDKLVERSYIISIMTALVEDDSDLAIQVMKKNGTCVGDALVVKNSKQQIYSYLEKKGEFKNLKAFVKDESDEELKAQYLGTLKRWYWDRSDRHLKEKVYSEFKSMNTPETTIMVTEIDRLEMAIKKSQQLKDQIIWDEDVFDGDKFNKALDAYLVLVSQFKADFGPLSQSKQTDLAILSTKLLSDLYFVAGNKIIAISPIGMDQAILKDFRGAMKEVGTGLLKASRQYQAGLEKVLRDKEVIISGGRYVASVESVENPIMIYLTGLTMDKGRE